jgi:hypothetical protein
MVISNKRTLGERIAKPLPEAEQPISEQFRVVAKEWADADAAASLLEELKTADLEERKSKMAIEIGLDTADNKLERVVKASPAWRERIIQMCDARSKANLLKMKLEWLRMRHSEWISRDAHSRHEYRLSRG